MSIFSRIGGVSFCSTIAIIFVVVTAAVAWATQERPPTPGKRDNDEASVDRFVPGEYTDVGREGRYTVRGPGRAGTHTVWTMQGDDGPDKRLDATWTTGSVKGNPQLANRRFLETLPQGFSYGRGNGSMFNVEGNPSSIIGVRQVGDSISISVFNLHQGSGRDDKPVYVEEKVLVYTRLKNPER